MDLTRLQRWMYSLSVGSRVSPLVRHPAPNWAASVFSPSRMVRLGSPLDTAFQQRHPTQAMFVLFPIPSPERVGRMRFVGLSLYICCVPPGVVLESVTDRL
jgi:hypothetical protein